MSNALLADDILDRPAKRRSRKRFLVAGGAFLALIGAAVYGADWFVSGQYIESTDDAYVGGNVTDLAPKVNGIIAQIAVADNAQVHAGDLLIKLDDRDYRAALAKAQAAVAGAQAALENLQAMRVLQLSVIGEATAALASANAQTVLARANQSRYRSLAASAAGSLQDSQTANANYAQASAGVQKAQAALAAAQAQLAVIGTQQLQAEATLAGAQADASTARLNLGYTQIRAPIDGVIGNRSAHVGAYATIGAQMVSIVPSSGLWVDANFKEDQLADMREGEPVTIIADVAPGAKIRGRVESIAPATGAIFSILPAQNATGNFTKIVQRVPVRIALDGDAARLGLLRPGLSVTASVNTK